MRTVQVGECAQVINGFAFKSNLFTIERRGLPIARIRDVSRGRSETYYTGDYPTSAVIQNGDLLIGMDGEFNIARWQGGRALLNQRVCKIEALSGRSDISYLHYALPVVLKRIEDRTPFVTVKHLSSEDLKEEPILLPDLSEQKRIAELLEQADRLRRSRRYALELSDSLLPAAFLNIFGDPVKNERDWQKASLDSIAMKITDGEHLNPEFVAEGLPIVMAEQVEELGVNLRTCKLVSTEDFTKFVKKCDPKAGDILIVSRGATIGRTCVVNTERPFCLMGSVILIKLDSIVVDPHFLAAQLKSASFVRILRTTSGASAQQAIYIAHLKDKFVIVPPLTRQKRFTDLVGRIERLRSVQQESLRQADHLFQSLLHRAFAAKD